MERNGYNPSIVQRNLDECYMCRRQGDLARHEPLDGIGRRKKSKALGLWVNLCPSCHERSHRDRETQDRLRRRCQMAYKAYYSKTDDDFIMDFGRSYL